MEGRRAFHSTEFAVVGIDYSEQLVFTDGEQELSARWSKGCGTATS